MQKSKLETAKILLRLIVIPFLLVSGVALGFQSTPSEHDLGDWPSSTHFQEMSSTSSNLNSVAVDGNNTTLIGRWANGPCYSTKIVGTTAYIGNGSYLDILNVSNPGSPIEMGKILLPSVVQDVIINGNYAYVADNEAGLRIINISNPNNPIETGYYDTGANASSVVVMGNYAYLADGWDGLRIINISDPVNPNEVGYYDTPYVAHSVVVNGDYAYIADGNSGLRVINVFDPSNPTEVGFLDTDGDAAGVFIEGNYAYLTDGPGGLRIIDIVDPSNPVEIGFYDTNNFARDVTVSGNFAYIADTGAGLRIIDITDKANPFEFGYFYTVGEAREVAISGSYAFVADYMDGLRIINISNPLVPFESGHFDTGSYAHNVAVNGNYMYVADFSSGLQIVNISDPSNPIVSGHYDAGGYAGDVTLSGNHAYVANWTTGLRIIDITDPSNPFESGFYDTGGQAYGVAVSGNYAYVADFNAGLRIIDISNPANPVETGFYQTNDYARSVAVSGNYAYVADYSDGLRIIDISNPANPFECGFFDTESYATDVTVMGNYAYVADSDDGLRIIDISNPTAPVEAGSFNTAFYATGVDVSGNYAYVADGYYSGLRIIDISDPANPTESGFWTSGVYSYGVTVSGDYVYLSDGENGVQIIQFNPPAVLLPQIALSADTLSAFPGDTVLVAVNCILPTDSTFSSMEFSFSGFQESLTFIGIETNGSLVGNAGWEVFTNNTSSLLITASGGVNEISGSGTLYWLKFFIPNVLNPGFIPVTITSALFNETPFDIIFDNGGVNVLAPIFYGDVSLNGEVRAYDAAMILKYLVGTEQLNNRQLWNANVSMDMSVSALDASIIFQYVVGLVDTLPVDGSQIQLLASGEVNLTDNETAPGSSLDIPVYLTNGGNILSFECQISFDPDVLTPTADFITLSDNNSSGFTIETDATTGLLKIAGASANPDGTNGTFATLHFNVSNAFAINQSTTVTIESMKFNDNIEQLDISATFTGVTGTTPDLSIPNAYALNTNYPNPFNPSTTLRYDLPGQGLVRFTIYNQLGVEVRTLINQDQSAGYHSVVWNGRDNSGKQLGTGIYFYRLDVNGFSQTRKMVLLK